MKKDSGRGEIGDRDDDLMLDMYHMRVVTIDQVQKLHFPSYFSARKRLYELSWMGMIENNIYSRKEKLNIWRLTKRGFKRQAEVAGTRDEQYREWPSSKNIRHYIETNDVYMLVSGKLDELLGEQIGEQPEWTWKDEARATHNWKIGAQSGTHRPDAEIKIGNRLYFIERQTARSKESKSYFDTRMAQYQGYFRYAQAERAVEGCEVVWACDKEQHQDYAFKAAQKYNIATVADGLIGACEHLLERAGKLANTMVR